MKEETLPKIRTCTTDDVPVLRDFYRRLYSEDGGAIPNEGVDGRLSELSLLAEVEDKPVGYVIGEKQTIQFMKAEIGRSAFPNDKHYLEVQDLYVLPEFRGKGIGSTLLKSVLERGRSNGLERSMVYSGIADHRSTSRFDYQRIAAFYEKCGYRMWHIFMTQ